MMKKGYIPYKDTFDHKGILLYFINYLGMLINETNGIWYVELLFITVTLYYIYKISKLVTNSKNSILVSLLSIIPLLNCYEYGNLTEEYAMPFIAISLYIYLNYLINGNVTKLKLIICGFSFGCVCLLRINMVVVWIVFCVYIAIKNIVEKKAKELIYFILFFCLGLAMLFLPSIIWLICNDALYDFWQSYFIFNLSYSSAEASIIESLANKMILGFDFLKRGSLFLSICVCFWGVINKKKHFLVYCIYLILNLFAISMSGNNYNHYAMIAIPSYAFPFAIFFENIFDNLENKTKKYCALLLVVFLIFTNCLSTKTYFEIAYTTINRISNKNSDSINEIVKYINENTNIDEKISVFGNWNVIYNESNRMHSTKYSFQYPLIEVEEKIEKEYFYQLEEELPKLIIIQGGISNELMDAFLTKHNYECVWQENKELDYAAIYSR